MKNEYESMAVQEIIDTLRETFYLRDKNKLKMKSFIYFIRHCEKALFDKITQELAKPLSKKGHKNIIIANKYVGINCELRTPHGIELARIHGRGRKLAQIKSLESVLCLEIDWSEIEKKFNSNQTFFDARIKNRKD